jgi:hypothetical protein
LRHHFAQRGWLCRYDIPMNTQIMACMEGSRPAPFTSGDGIQVWENPRLTGRSDLPSYVIPTVIRG